MELQELSSLSYNDFKEYLNQNFNIRFETTVTLKAELTELKEFDSYSPLERKPFSMIFRTEQKTEYYPQATFIVEHPKNGELPIFLTPKGLDAKGMMYEAIFS
jgi:hypothetical protein